MDLILPLLVAAACGAAVGVERESRHKPAGLRTMMLITVGAALFTIASLRLAARAGGDPGRIAAQIVAGIGFLGAGAIMRAEHDTITGLTTAATIWVAAALGMAAGAGFAGLAFAGTVLTVVVLRYVDQLEIQLDEKYHRWRMRVEATPGQGAADAVRRALRRLRVRIESIEQLAPSDDRIVLAAVYSATAPAQARLTREIERVHGILKAEFRLD